MKSKKTGSALLVVLMIMTVLLLYLTTIWQTAGYTYEIMRCRKEYEERLWSTHALMMWAIALSKENFDTLVSFVQYGPKTITIKHWPPWSKKYTHGSVEFGMLDGDQLALKVTTGTKKGKNSSVRCIFKREKKGDQEVMFIIQNWEEK